MRFAFASGEPNEPQRNSLIDHETETADLKIIKNLQRLLEPMVSDFTFSGDNHLWQEIATWLSSVERSQASKQNWYEFLDTSDFISTEPLNSKFSIHKAVYVVLKAKYYENRQPRLNIEIKIFIRRQGPSRWEIKDILLEPKYERFY